MRTSTSSVSISPAASWSRRYGASRWATGPVPTPAKDLARSGPSPLISGHQRPLSAVVAPGCRG
ncbi:hypothetical protein HMPREF1550_02711 [Actinomyces sp. oral taxon 877 str. F0543]|nr:hypothetical protein HMPREF1550_02711 [Actinomyces sp. oral taxon 877 str. F0543]